MSISIEDVFSTFRNRRWKKEKRENWWVVVTVDRYEKPEFWRKKEKSGKHIILEQLFVILNALETYHETCEHLLCAQTFAFKNAEEKHRKMNLSTLCACHLSWENEQQRMNEKNKNGQHAAAAVVDAKPMETTTATDRNVRPMNDQQKDNYIWIFLSTFIEHEMHFPCRAVNPMPFSQFLFQICLIEF